MVRYQMAKFTKLPVLIAISLISEAHAKRYLKERQGIELQKVPVLIPTTCKVELVELHPSDNREEILQKEGIHIRNMTLHHPENYVAAFHLSS